MRKQKFKLLYCTFFLFAFISLNAQSQPKITGIVKSNNGQLISGASIRLEGTNKGAITNSEGKFFLSEDQKSALGKKLRVSAVGFVSKDVLINSDYLEIILDTLSAELKDVIVVGYNTTTKQAFTGSVATIKSDRVENKSVSNVSQALAGEVPGVRVINTSGQPGTSATIRIRGFGSVNGNRDPLYVVDGIPYGSDYQNGSDYSINILNSINPDDIETINVLSDAVATAIYGSRGANGVIVITTKSGRNKEPYVQVDQKYGVNKSLIPRYSVIKSPEQYIGLAWEAMYNEGAYYAGSSDPAAYANKYLFSSRGIASAYNMWKVSSVADLIDSSTRTVKSGVQRLYTPENWEDYAFQSAAREETNLQLGGGDSKTNYYTSIGYLNDKGYSINSNFRRISARMNLNHQVNNWLSGSMNLGYANSLTNVGGQESNSNSVFWFVDNMPPIFPLFLRDANGQKIPDPYFGGYQYDYGDQGRGFGSLTNAIADAHYNVNKHTRNDFNGNTFLKVSFSRHFSFKSQFGFQYYNDDYVNLVNKFYGSAASQNGSIEQRKTEYLNYDWLNIFNYDQSFGKHHLNALAAHEANSTRQSILDAFKWNLVQSDNEELDNAVDYQAPTSYTDRVKIESYFAQANYDYDNTYYFSASIRTDGSSRFLKNKWGTFGSLGLGWVVSNEDFLKNSSILKYLKLKASYGIIGDQEGVGYYPGYNTAQIQNANDSLAIPPYDVIGNPDLTWERSKVFQVGTEFTLGSIIDGSVDYFIKNTSDLIFDRRIGPSIGYALIKVNDGELRNQGLEFSLTGHILKGSDYFLDLGVNGEALSNKLTKMPIDPSTGKPKIIDVEGLYGWGKNHSIYDYYMREFDGVDPADGTSTWTEYYDDVNNNGTVDDGEGITSLQQFKADNPDKVNEIKKTTTKTYSEATQFYVGKNAIPKLRGALNLTGGFKGFDLSVQLLYSFGGYAYDGAYATLMDDDLVGTNNWSTDILKRWQKPGDKTDVPRITNGNDANVASSSTRFLTQANYLLLNNVKLGYNIPHKLLDKYSIKDLSVWVSGDNLWLHSKRKGFNPSTAEDGGSDMYRYSPLSTFSAGISLKF